MAVALGLGDNKGDGTYGLGSKALGLSFQRSQMLEGLSGCCFGDGREIYRMVLVGDMVSQSVSQSINQSICNQINLHVCMFACSFSEVKAAQYLFSTNDKASGNKWEARAASSSKYG